MFFSLDYSQNIEQIEFKIAIRYNLQVYIDRTRIPFTSQQNIFEFQLPDFGSQASLIIPNKNYVVWGNISLSNDPQTLQLSSVETIVFDESILNEVFQTVN